MAAAALLRSVANKMARAPSMHHRPLLARGVHGGGGAGSSGPAGVSLPPPTSNEHARWDDRSVVSVAALRSLGTKLMARAPPQQQQHQYRLLHQRGLHTTTTPNSGASGFTPPPTSSKVFGVRDSELQRAKIRVAVAYITLFSGVIYLHGWVNPPMKKLKHQVNTLSRERRILMEKIKFMEEIKAIEDMLSMQRLGHGAVLGGASEKGTRVKKVEKEVAEVQCTENQIKELQALVATTINELEERLEKVQHPENRDEELEAVALKEFLPQLTRLKIALDRAA